MKTKVIKLKNRPVGVPEPGDFIIEEEHIAALKKGQLLLRSIYISVDPYLRGKMSGTKIPRFELNEPLTSKLIAEVIATENEAFQKGDIVSHYLDWKEYQVSDGTGLKKIEAAATHAGATAASLSAHLGILGVTGLSAYFALMDIGKPAAGETLVVSGAAGAVGSIAGQIGKLMGCRVVGIAGSDQKVHLLKTKFGFDEAINYKTTPDLKSAIAQACPAGVDIYFDNVGGPISDAVLANINTYGRIPVCGTIASYNDTTTTLSPSLLPLVVYKFLTIRGFLIADFAPRFPEGMQQLTSWLKEGRLRYSETITEGFENLPAAFIGLFEGKNEGKMLVYCPVA